MYRIAIPMERVTEKRETRPRRPRFDGERAVEIYFTVLTIVILGMIVGIAAYAVNSLIPAWQEHQYQQWQRTNFPRNMAYPYSDFTPSPTLEPK